MGDAARELPLAWSPKIAEVYAALNDLLTDDGRALFEDEIATAVVRVMTSGDVRPLNDTLAAWYRTMLFQRSGVNDRFDQLPEFDPDDVMTAAQVRQRLNV